MALAYVEYDPAPGSPADEAGLCVGDAILRFGVARTLEDLPALLVPGAPLLLVVRHAATHAVPRRETSRRLERPRATDCRCVAAASRLDRRANRSRRADASDDIGGAAAHCGGAFQGGSSSLSLDSTSSGRVSSG